MKKYSMHTAILSALLKIHCSFKSALFRLTLQMCQQQRQRKSICIANNRALKQQSYFNYLNVFFLLPHHKAFNAVALTGYLICLHK